MIALVRRRPLAAFFVLAYLGSWALWSPWWLSRSGVGVLPFELPFVAVAGVNQLGLFAGPFASALLVTRVVEGRGGASRLLRRLAQWRAHPFWHVLALVLIPAAAGLGYLWLPGATVTLDGGVIAGLGVLTGTYLTYLLGGPLQEEVGWRGFALPRLQARLSPVAAALALGVVHCLWHAPLFLTAEWDTARGGPSQFLAYLLLVVSLSIVLSWLSNGSRGSVLLAILGHNGVNWALFAAGALAGRAVDDNWPAALGLAALAIITIAVTRGRLGCRATRADGGEPSPRPGA
jgi:membrane protease YdiL (CAAX protease family)